MKTQFIVLIVAIVFLQLLSQSEAIFSAIAGLLSNLLGKRDLRHLDLDQFDDMFDQPEISAADMKFLQDLLR
uniref:Non-disulfide-bridged peptide 5.5 n=1 Tax=Hoffmannihadrurus gertschi TaxID=380989 RepID=NDB4S_HOFGE|nr:RecName: Full=Non-disulfide-bridged peptide 5.5; Short=NDBP-5.5; Flags: Precursor [Hadrurus gertschi]